MPGLQKGSMEIDDNDDDDDSDNEESDLVKLKASRKMNTAEANPDAVIDNAVKIGRASCRERV